MADIKGTPASNTRNLQAIKKATEAAEASSELVADATERLAQIMGAFTGLELAAGERVE